MNSRIWGVTGRTGTGKTKVINTLHYRLLSNNISMGGVLTRDIKNHGKRTGIEIQNISTGINYEIANVNKKTGPRLQKFRIDLENIDLVVLFGPNNRKLHKIGEYFPDLKLVARGNTLKILGQNNQITSFEKKFESFINHIHQYR